MVQPVFERWNGYLEDVEARHAELMAAALSRCADAHQAAGLDPAPIDVAWSAVDGEAVQLQQGIDAAFRGPMAVAFNESGATAEFVTEQGVQGAAFARRLARTRERTRVTVYADAARRILQAAMDEQTTQHLCTECGEPIQVPDGTFVAVQVFCAMCGKPQQYEPGGWVQLAGSWCPHPLAEERAFAAWSALQDAEHARMSASYETLEAIQRHGQAYHGYARAYFTGRAALIPGYGPTLEQDVQSWMDAFHQGLEASSVWVDAGRPRSIG
jgi:hypothetical protein